MPGYGPFLKCMNFFALNKLGWTGPLAYTSLDPGHSTIRPEIRPIFIHGPESTSQIQPTAGSVNLAQSMSAASPRARSSLIQ